MAEIQSITKELAALEDGCIKLDRELNRGRFWLIRRSIRYWWQRRTRGWDDSELWSLDYTAAKFLLPRLKRFKETTMSYPGHETPGTWEAKIDEMIYAMNAIVHQWGTEEEDKVDWRRVQRGCSLLGRYFRDLWS